MLKFVYSKSYTALIFCFVLFLGGGENHAVDLFHHRFICISLHNIKLPHSSVVTSKLTPTDLQKKQMEVKEIIKILLMSHTEIAASYRQTGMLV